MKPGLSSLTWRGEAKLKFSDGVVILTNKHQTKAGKLPNLLVDCCNCNKDFANMSFMNWHQHFIGCMEA